MNDTITTELDEHAQRVVIERWRLRCLNAIWCGEGMPTRRHFIFWKKPDREKYAPGLAGALAKLRPGMAVHTLWTDILENHRLARVTSRLAGIDLAITWLWEEFDKGIPADVPCEAFGAVCDPRPIASSDRA